MARTVTTGTVRLPRSLLEELYDASTRFASVAETLEVLMDKKTMRRIKMGHPYLGLRLVGQLEGFWKDRVGQYRILYAIDEKNKTIILHDVDLRKRVYD